jgi:CRISPR/Cas system-associated exonuclease Cas4 (RecB family)
MTEKFIKVEKLKSWSFSRYTDYKKCPARVKYKHIMKMPEPPSAAMERGNVIHKLCEQYVKGEISKLPVELKLFKEEFTKLRKLYKSRKLPIIVEDNWAFDVEWGESAWNDWVNCWVRIKLDCAHYEDGNTLYVTDYKTGKMSDYKNTEYMEQLSLYALAALLLSSVEDVTIVPRLLYLDSGDIFPPVGQEVTYTRADTANLLKVWNKNVKPMMNDTRFAPTPSANACRFCSFSSAKGGPCKY